MKFKSYSEYSVSWRVIDTTQKTGIQAIRMHNIVSYFMQWFYYIESCKYCDCDNVLKLATTWENMLEMCYDRNILITLKKHANSTFKHAGNVKTCKQHTKTLAMC